MSPEVFTENCPVLCIRTEHEETSQAQGFRAAPGLHEDPLSQPSETRPPALRKNTLALGVCGTERSQEGRLLENARDQGPQFMNAFKHVPGGGDGGWG